MVLSLDLFGNGSEKSFVSQFVCSVLTASIKMLFEFADAEGFAAPVVPQKDCELLFP
jgi:hypothetical protein